MKNIGIGIAIGCFFLIGISVGSYLYPQNNIVHTNTPLIDDSNILSPVPSAIPKATPKTEIIVTGDVMLGRSVNKQSQKYGDYTWPFSKTNEVLKSADITLVNLENPVVENCPPHDSGFIFCSPPESVEGLVFAGIDIVSLANNHSTNYGSQGLSSSREYLSKAGIEIIGLESPVIRTVNNTKFAFLGYNDVGNSQAIAHANIEDIIQDIEHVKNETDVVIAFFHWGEEYRREPTDRQITLAHAAIDAGADFVLGAHPHWRGTHEVYKGKNIYYSLGNFIFDQEWSQETKKGLAVKLSYQGRALIGIDELPVLIKDYGQAQWVEENR